MATLHILVVGHMHHGQSDLRMAPRPRDIALAAAAQDQDCDDAFAIGGMDSDDGVACDPIGRYSDPLARQAYMSGYHHAALGLGTLHSYSDEDVAAMAADLEDDMADRDFWAHHC